MSAALAGEAFPIYGNDYATPDRTAVRDYVHVADVATAHLAALEKLAAPEEHGFSAINIGSGAGTSIREAIKAIEKASGARVEVQEHPRRAGDPPRLVADISKAQSQLGWRPRQSDINRIVKSLLPK
jgi:UDP-glucose 4-epimerase